MFIRKYWILLLVVIAFILYVANLFIKSPTQTNKTHTNTPPSATFKSLVPGISTPDQVAEQLGKPVSTKTVNGETISQYKSTNQYRFNEVIYTNGSAQLIKEIVNSNDNINADYVTNVYGVAPYMFYNTLSNNHFNLYVYPQNGIAYLGHTDGTLLEIWYFQPTTIDDFVKTWADGYSLTPPTPSGY